MLKHYSYIILLLLVSSCSSPQKTNFASVVETPTNAELQLINQWQLSSFQEPVFHSQMAILEAGNKNNPPIILIHGLGQLGMKDWFSIIPILEAHYHVIAVDLPGFGLSTNAKGRFSPENYSKVIAAVNRQYIHKKAIVIGHSMGGAVALRYTDLYPEHVQKLILIDAAGLLEKSAFVKHIATFEFGDKFPIFIQQQIAKMNNFTSSMIEVTTRNNFFTDFLQKNDYAWNWLFSDSTNMNTALSLVEEDFSQAVQNITIPVEIIWGEKDAVAPLRTGKVLNKQIKNSRLQIIKEAGHVPMKSNYSQFIDALYVSLNQPISNSNRSPKIEDSKGSLICRGERGKIYTGHYDEIIIENCNNIQLINIRTDKLLIEGSIVDIEGLSFDNNDNPIEFSGSVITITNADISGKNALLIDSSRLDIAGVSIEATGDAVSVANRSRISASFSNISSPKYTGLLHGLFYLKNQILINSK